MKNPLAIFREAGGFIAGLLIGLSIVVFVFAMMVVDPSDRQAMWGAFGAPMILAVGLTLQVVVTTTARRRRTVSADDPAGRRVLSTDRPNSIEVP
jgi:multisubunit Na+/H+ antiporter MnhB subunit